MKVAICVKCSSFLQLGKEFKSCTCGEIKGRYLDNGDDIEVTEGTYVMGIANNDIAWAISNSKYTDEGLRKVRCWIFNPEYHKIKYLPK